MTSNKLPVQKTEAGPNASNNSMELSPVEFSILHLRSRLVPESNSPFYCVLGYTVAQTILKAS